MDNESGFDIEEYMDNFSKSEDYDDEEDTQELIDYLKDLRVPLKKQSKIIKKAKKLDKSELEEKIRNLANINTIIFISKEKEKHEYEYITIMVMQGTSEYETVEELTERICQYLYKINKTVWLRHFITLKTIITQYS